MHGILEFTPKKIVVVARCTVLACCAMLLALPSGVVAQSIDVSLNLDYADNADLSSGGTWQLAVKTSDAGLAAISLGLTGIAPPNAESIRTPSGIVNNGDAAGLFGEVATFPTAGYFAFTAGSQAPVAAGEQPWIYGIGSIVDPAGGSPNFPGQDPETTSIGPELTTFAQPEFVPWGTGDFLNEVPWQHAAILFGGTFAAGQTPAFYAADGFVNEGGVFLTAPSMADELGTLSASFEVTTTVRSDFGVFVAGDYNADGTVNLADYTLWRDTLGATVDPGTGADGMPDGLIDSADYTVWKNNFGASAGSLVANSLQTSRVPEPQSVTLTLFAAMVIGVAKRRISDAGQQRFTV